jgi:hypothetical protein
MVNYYQIRLVVNTVSKEVLGKEVDGGCGKGYPGRGNSMNKGSERAFGDQHRRNK